MPNQHINQIDLIAAITIHLAKKEKIKSFIPREFNTIVSCANKIIEEFEKPESIVIPGMGLKAWLETDQTGMSSCYMASKLGGFYRDYYHPLDSADFGRCVGLLKAVPEFRSKIPEMASCSNQWKALSENWDELEMLHEKEEFKRLNQRISELITEK